MRCRAVRLPVASTTASRGRPARPKSSRYIQARARKCGSCQTKSRAKSDHASADNGRAAAQPMTTGRAPGTAPTRTAQWVLRFSGV